MRIHIVPSYTCNLDCDFCYAAGFENSYKESMSFDLFVDVINYFKLHGLKSVSFLGGEPTLWPFIESAINYARGNGLETVIFSNGSKRSARPHLAVLNLTRFLSKSFSQTVLDNIKWYRENGVQLNFRINLTKDQTSEYLDDMLTIARSVDAELQFAAIDCTPYDVEFGEKIYRWIHSFISQSFSVRISRPLLKCVFTDSQYEFISKYCSLYSKCNFGNSVPVINPDGKTVYPCNSLTLPFPLDYVWSKRNAFKEIRFIYNNLDKIVPSECSGCPEFTSNECHAGCLGKRIKNIDIVTRKRTFFLPGDVLNGGKCENNCHWDWGMVAKVVSKSVNNHNSPISGYIKQGYSCNNHCDFCAVEWDKSLGDRNYLEIIKEIDLLLDDKSINAFHYSGGEPTLCKDLPEILEYVRSKGIEQQIIQTNGRKLSSVDYLKKLIKSGATSFFVSIHGVDADMHDKQVNSNSAFDQTVKGLKNLNNLGQKFSTNTLVTKNNYKSLPKIIQFIANEFPSVQKAKLSYPNILGGAADNYSDVIVPLWDCITDIKNAIYMGRSYNLFVNTESVPICLLGELSDHACEFVQHSYNFSDLHYHEKGGTINNRAKNFVFYDKCNECDVKYICSGIHPAHDKEFKFNDIFEPISFNKIGVNPG